MRAQVDRSTVLSHADGSLAMTPSGADRWLVEVLQVKRRVYVHDRRWETRHPPALVQAILDIKGPGWTIDELKRAEDPQYVYNDFRHDIFSFVASDAFRGRRVLDFGCGCGASTMVLLDLAPGIRITGVDQDPDYLRIARSRFEHFGLAADFALSPATDRLPEDLGRFDFVVLSAVMEHLLPGERSVLLPLIWDRLEPGGVLFLNQTPHRWFPIEGHTTGLPMLNYLPDGFALRAARALSRRVERRATWETLLRDGIRGATTSEIMSVLKGGGGRASNLEPRCDGVVDHLDLWCRSAAVRHRGVDLVLRRLLLKTIRGVTGVTVVPNLSLALRKEN